MHFRYNALQGSRPSNDAPQAQSGLTSASEERYSACISALESICPANRGIAGGAISGRGPPGRRRRSELQAMSNSLQLTSW